jgi:hypothetical protein
MSSVFVAPVLTPHGHLILSEDRDASALEPELARRLGNALARGSGHGLLQFGASEVGVALPPSSPIAHGARLSERWFRLYLCGSRVASILGYVTGWSAAIAHRCEEPSLS